MIKKCPYCGSDIPVDVKKCKYCGEWLVIQDKDKPKASMHLGVIIEVLIAILSIPIGIKIGADSAISFIIAAYIILNLYFLPTLIADGKRTQYTLAIFAINFLLGWTVIAWIGSLVWALILPNLSKNTEKTSISTENPKFYTQAKNSNEKFQEKSMQKINTLEISGETKRCPYCAELIPKTSTYCNICDTPLNENYYNRITQIECTGVPQYTQISNEEQPNDIQQWNWGAFWFSWIWGIANKSYLTFLVLIPFFGFIWMFICGAKGNEWAWKNKDWASVEEFNEVQKKWAIVGNCIAIPLLILIILMQLLFGMGQQDIHEPANKEKSKVQQMKSNSAAEENIDIIEQYDYSLEKDAKNAGVSSKCLNYTMTGIGSKDSCTKEDGIKAEKYLKKMAENDYYDNTNSVNENKPAIKTTNVKTIPEQRKQTTKVFNNQDNIQKPQEAASTTNVVVPQAQPVQTQQSNQEIDDFMN